MHGLEGAMQPPHPIFPPGMVTAQRVLKETVESHVAAAQEIRAAIQHCAPGLMIEAKLPHPKERAKRVRPGARLQLVKKGIFRRPQPAVPDWNPHLYGLLGVAVECNLFRGALASVLSRARLAHLEAQLRA